MKPKKLDPRKLREKSGLNQTAFWSEIGVTQSGGSRYETGRNIPRPVRLLLQIVYVQGHSVAALMASDGKNGVA